MEALLTSLLANGITQLLAYIGSIGGVAIAFPLLLEAVKRSQRFPAIDEYTDTINRTVAVIFAVASSAGISYAYDGAVGQFVLLGVSPLGIAKFLMGVAGQFGLQEMAYRYIVKGSKR